MADTVLAGVGLLAVWFGLLVLLGLGGLGLLALFMAREERDK